jgi:long-subunit acyl-CoA synthetase (AMP-forming)
LKVFPKALIINFYGPTEFTINATFCIVNKNLNKNLIDQNNNISIGKPLKNVKIKIQMHNNQNYGELLLSGNQNMLGYINSNLSKKIIINNKKYYATGDIVSLNKSNNIFFIGRKKDYIKFKGFRVNLQNISSKISKICQAQVVVLIKKNRLMAFSKKKLFKKDKEKILSKLDKIEFPEKFIRVKDFPILPNNKIDKKKIENNNFKNEY